MNTHHLYFFVEYNRLEVPFVASETISVLKVDEKIVRANPNLKRSKWDAGGSSALH